MNRSDWVFLATVVLSAAAGLFLLYQAEQLTAEQADTSMSHYIDAENNVMCYVHSDDKGKAMDCLPYNDEGDRLQPVWGSVP
jgi:hypothetical protein